MPSMAALWDPGEGAAQMGLHILNASRHPQVRPSLVLLSTATAFSQGSTSSHG